MKYSSSLPSKNKRSEGGFALIIILAAIVLLLALVVGFFSRVQSELQSSSTYQSTGSARNLSDYAVNLVLAQIKAGTRGQTTNGSVTAWASQPGAIRTFDTSGNLLSVYKLYSAQNMVVSSIDAANEASALNNWSSARAIFTDLNEPVGDQFPILDPSAKTVVKGFSIKTLPSGGSSNEAPMPARWLYILKDGQIVFPTGSGNSAGVAGASTNNPIVGRIAFWTDDDSSKININTAGGGPWQEPELNITYRYGGASTLNYRGPGFSSFWTTPVVFTKQEGALAATQPTQMEYQRYPGHPANTYLTAALPNLNSADDIYSLLPRVQNQGSKGGSVAVDSAIKVRTDADRLYQSVDELLFRPSLAGTERQTNATVSKSDLEKAKFFLTANSRSPDVNMFNEPCVSMWPITLNKNTPFDRLIAFCETIPSAAAGGKPYYFTRNNPNSQSDDLTQRNLDIITYLRKKTSDPVPGFGGAGILSKYGTDNRDQILTEIFDYIRTTNPRDSSQGGTNYHYASTGAVVPIYDQSTRTRGFGRFPTITKVGLLIYGVGINQNDADQSTVTADVDREATRGTFKLRVAAPGASVPPAKGKLVMQAALIFEMFSPAQGYNLFNPDCTIRVSGLNNFLWNGSPMFQSDTALVNFRGGNSADWGNENISLMWGGRIGIRALGAVTTSQGIDYPFAGKVVSPEVDAWSGGTGSRPTFTFSGGMLTFTLSSSGETVQTVRANLDGSSFPVPDLAPYVTGDKLTADFRNISERLQIAKADEFVNAWITDSDVVQTTNVESGDFRIISGMSEPPSSLFVKHPYYGTKMRAHNFFMHLPAAYYGAGLGAYNKPTPTYRPVTTAYESLDGSLYRQRANNWAKRSGSDDYTAGFSYSRDTYLADTYSTEGVKVGGSGNVLGDYDNGVGRAGDGPYINFADEGTTGKNGAIGYLGGVTGITELGPNFFTPNRMISSAAMLGSLPTQIKSTPPKPWQTLLFRPSPAGHPGLDSPPDYLLLDFFKMPIVEPYAISEPLSTAGRVNMNYQILPYNYFDRSTAVRAVLRSEQMLAIPNSEAILYKAQTTAAKLRFRYKLDLSPTGTLKGFENRFANNDIFRSASEICSIWLVPDLDDNENTFDVNYDSMPTWWDNFVATADNSKEASYARIYPRLTTKSNTYTVHYRVQALKKPKAGSQTTWTEDVDKVQSEYRGSTTIERYIDPNDSKIPDYITASAPDSLDTFYKFRVLSQKQFNP